MTAPPRSAPPGGETRLAWWMAVTAVVGALSAWAAAVGIAAVDHDLAAMATSVSVVGFAVVGLLVQRRRPDNRLGLLFCAGALALALKGATQRYAHHALVEAPGSWPGGLFAAWFSDLFAAPTIGLFALVVPQLFPTGRPVSPRWRISLAAAGAYIVLAAAGNAIYPQQLESVPGVQNPHPVEQFKGIVPVVLGLAGLVGAVALVSGIAGLVVRWRRSGGDARQQLKWFLAGVALMPVPLIVHDSAPLAADAMVSVLLVVIPGTMGVAILRYHLYDLDVVVNRALVYAAVTTVVGLLYVAIVVAGEATVGGDVSLGWHVAAAVVTAAVFQPLRSWVQRVVDRLFYGDRARPYDAVARLGRRLEHALDPDTVLHVVAETVTDALRLPYAAIELVDAGRPVTSARFGEPSGDVIEFPMIYQADEVGRLIVSPRRGDVRFSEADRRLLEDLARHVGAAAHAVRTTAALQRSRTELVAAREEERRRLRRDLHDGLGPALAGINLGVRAARLRAPTDPDVAVATLGAIESQIAEAIADIRRLVYGLRPPALDEFGLVRAVELHASRLEEAEALKISVEAPAGGLGRLPAAVEVAAYRIATEALTNVTRHAGARACRIRFTRNGTLEVEIRDDGHGMAVDHRRGVGLEAMRERAEELGGSLMVESTASGTRVVARLPEGDPE